MSFENFARVKESLLPLICSHTMWNWWYVMDITMVEWIYNGIKGENLENSGWLAPEFIMTQTLMTPKFSKFSKSSKSKSGNHFWQILLKTLDRSNPPRKRRLDSLPTQPPFKRSCWCRFSYRHVLKWSKFDHHISSMMTRSIARFWIFMFGEFSQKKYYQILKIMA